MTAALPVLRDFLSLRYSAGGHPLTRFVSQPAGAVLAWLAGQARLSPNAVTLAGGAVALAAAWLFATGPRGLMGLIWPALLLQLSYALDCADGQLARATGHTSPLGGWLDVFIDMASISSLAFAATFWALRSDPTLAGVAMLAGWFYCFARLGNLLTCTLVRKQAGNPVSRAEGQRKRLLLVVIDTPVVLLCIALLRHQERLLCAYLALIGLVFTLHSLYVATALRSRP